ncbi:MAG TPA: diguanylate cyclase [Verrucomicrobiae bacterium]|nr:diguanylate cyclase [Verrucomicrobiae bacterium]
MPEVSATASGRGPRLPEPFSVRDALGEEARGVALLSVVVLAGLIVWASSQPGWLRALGLLGLLLLGWRWAAPRGRHLPAAPAGLIDLGSLLLATLATGNPALALGVVYAAAGLGSLEAGRRLAAGRMVAVVAVYLVAAALTGTAGGPVAAVTAVIPGLPLVTALGQLLREAADRRRSDRRAARVRALAADLGAHPTVAAVVAAARRGVRELVGDGPAPDVMLVTDSVQLIRELGELPGLPRPVAGGSDPGPGVPPRLRRAGEVTRSDPCWEGCARLLGLAPDARRLLVAPLPLSATEGGPWATLAVASPARLSAGATDAWHQLTDQLGRSLERAWVFQIVAGSEARFRAFVESTSDLIIAVDRTGRLVYASSSVPQFLGRPLDLDEPPPWQRLVHPDDVAAVRASFVTALQRPGPGLPVDCRLLARDGGWRSFDVVPTNLLDHPGAGAMVLNLRDISERVELEAQLRHQALHDPLTGLANRVLLRDRLEHALAARERVPHRLVLLLLDLDHFKYVNDTFGHEAGDQVLLEVTRRIRRCLRGSDTCARLGGDEFAILVEDAGGPETGAVLAARILVALRRPVRVSETVRVTMAASVGIAEAVEGPVDPRQLLQACDIALYSAKAQGRGRYVVHAPGLEERTGDWGEGEPGLALAGSGG